LNPRHWANSAAATPVTIRIWPPPLAAHANFVVSYDKDLLEVKKPFGIEIIRPAQFLKLVKG
jgi:hypothetical protein